MVKVLVKPDHCSASDMVLSRQAWNLDPEDVVLEFKDPVLRGHRKTGMKTNIFDIPSELLAKQISREVEDYRIDLELFADTGRLCFKYEGLLDLNGGRDRITPCPAHPLREQKSLDWQLKKNSLQLL